MPILGVIASGISGNLITGAFDSIATVTTTAGQTAVNFLSIPATYKHLQVRGIARANESNPGDGSGIYMRLNGNNAANYWYQRIYCVRGTANNNGAADYQANTTYPDCGIITSASQPASIYGGLIIDIPDYANVNIKHSGSVQSGFATTSSSTNQYTHTGAFAWNSASAIYEINMIVGTGSFAAGSVISLYGIKG
jgi:hypothetical protein